MTKEYYEQHKEEILKKAKAYRDAHKKERSEYQKKYYEGNKEKLLEYQEIYRDEHREEKNEKQKTYYKEHSDECKEWQKEYRSTKIGRAKMLIHRYQQNDENHNRGECTLTVENLIELWEKGCYWCGEKDWLKLGADRIDNNKAHTIDNVVCACKCCNDKRGSMTFEGFSNI